MTDSNNNPPPPPRPQPGPETLRLYSPDETGEQARDMNEERRRRQVESAEAAGFMAGAHRAATPLPLAAATQGFQGAAARSAVLRPRISNATLAPIGTPEMPAHEAAAVLSARGGFIADAQVMVPVIPTEYPVDPTTGMIVVQNHITIVDTAALNALNSKITELCELIRQSNDIAGEPRDKLLAEIAAGVALLNAPKPDPKMIDLLLTRPLKWVAERAAGVVVATAAGGALVLLGKATGLW